jgi:uncharacterized membrane protein YvbJ
MDYTNRETQKGVLDESREKIKRKRTLWIVTLVLWAILLIIITYMTVDSRRFEFDGISFSFVSYEPRTSITLVDNSNNYLIVTSDQRGTFTAEYLGETFTYSRITGNMPSTNRTRQISEPEHPRRGAEVAFILEVIRTIDRGPITNWFALFWAVICFLMILISVASYLYPYKFSEISLAINPHVRDGKPTEFAILSARFGGVLIIVVTFVITFMILSR